MLLPRRVARAFPSLNQAVRRLAGVRTKAAEVDDAVYRIPNNATITVGGFVAQSCAEYVLEALGRRYEETSSPSNLTLVFGGGPGDYATKGLNHFAQPGMIKRTIGSHYGQTPMLAEMVLANEIEAYFVPMGSISRMVRSAASKSPGHITTVGFGTMVDPRNGGGKLNAKTTEDLIEVVDILGKKYLLYKSIPIDVAIVRGTTGDDCGNITMEHESLLCDHMIQAMAARSTRGLVIAEVEHIVSEHSLRARDVKIPGTMVDCVVARPLEYQQMSFFTSSNDTWIGDSQSDGNQINDTKTAPFSLGSRKIIARRAAMEIQPNDVINLGIGMPEGVALVAEEESILPFIELTTEPGVHGGVGATGHDFGPGAYPHAFLEMHQQFDFYNGGSLDNCFLGNAETDAQGNVNVSKVGNKLTGPGGFIDISQCTKRVNFLGTFTAGGLEISAANGKLEIVKEGSVKKFVKAVREVTFCGAGANKTISQKVNYITERCVFELDEYNQLELVEIAPGIDLEKDILGQMDFMPKIKQPLRLMDQAIFTDAPMQLRELYFSDIGTTSKHPMTSTA